MNKIFSIATVVALVATLSFAQGTKIGVRAGFFFNDPTGSDSKEFDMGWGAGGGLAAVIPISGDLSVRTGVEFNYSKMFSMEMDDVDYVGGIPMTMKMEMYANEFLLSIPVMAQYGIGDAWVGAGAQIGIPFSSEMHSEVEMAGISVSDSKKLDDRASVDVGIAVGAGYNITPNIAVDLKAVIGMTNVADDEKISFNQYGLGLTYFF